MNRSTFATRRLHSYSKFREIVLCAAFCATKIILVNYEEPFVLAQQTTAPPTMSHFISSAHIAFTIDLNFHYNTPRAYVAFRVNFAINLILSRVSK